MRSYELAGWRRIANAIWDAPSDPQIYGSIDVEASAISRFIERARGTGHRVTATHLVGRAVAHALAKVPDLNVRLVGSRAIPRPSADIFFITAVGKGRDLTGVKIAGVDRKTAIEVGAELTRRSGQMKAGHDPDFARTKKLMDRMPLSILRPALRAAAWFAGDRDMSSRMLGIAASPFGSAMVSSVGMLGIPTGFAPLAWMYRVPLLVLVGKIADKPVVREGRVEAVPMIPLTVTIDHRYVDGSQIGAALEAFQAYLADPSAFEPSFAPVRSAKADCAASTMRH